MSARMYCYNDLLAETIPVVTGSEKVADDEDVDGVDISNREGEGRGENEEKKWMKKKKEMR